MLNFIYTSKVIIKRHRFSTIQNFNIKTDVTPAIFSRNFVARVFSRDRIASVTWRLARVFTVALCSILCNSVDRMLNADWSVVIVVFVLLLFTVHIRLFA